MEYSLRTAVTTPLANSLAVRNDVCCFQFFNEKKKQQMS